MVPGLGLEKFYNGSRIKSGMTSGIYVEFCRALAFVEMTRQVRANSIPQKLTS